MDRRIIAANDTFRRLTGRPNPRARPARRSASPFARAPSRTATTSRSRRPRAAHLLLARRRHPRRGRWRLLLHSIARDVTDERLAAQAREEARQKAEYNSASKSRLLATVSHELRTPLSGILGMTHL
jgi:signal transduction histidine kinase